MFDVFGNVDSAEELNEIALSLREENEKENLDILLKENGIDSFILDSFMAEEIDFITDIEGAAVGKLQVELANLKKDKYIDVIKERTVDYLMTQCEDENFAIKVRHSSKSLDKCMDTCVEAIKKEIGGNSGGVSDTVVFLCAKNYYKQ